MTESAKQSEQAVTMMSQRNTGGSMYTDKVVILDPKYAGIEGGQEYMLKLLLLLQAEITRIR